MDSFSEVLCSVFFGILWKNRIGNLGKSDFTFKSLKYMISNRSKNHVAINSARAKSSRGLKFCSGFNFPEHMQQLKEPNVPKGSETQNFKILPEVAFVNLGHCVLYKPYDTN